MEPSPEVSYLPSVSLTKRVAEIMGDPEKMGVEALFLLPMPAREDPLLFLLNRLTAVSTLEGIEYYSASRNEYRVLFTRAYALSETGSPNPDPSFSELPDEYNLQIFMNDTTFGEGRYRLTYHTAEDCILATLVNLTPLHLGPLKVVTENNVAFSLLAIPTDGGLLLYASGAARPKVGKMFSGTLERSLSNRIFALKDWLAEGVR